MIDRRQWILGAGAVGLTLLSGATVAARRQVAQPFFLRHGVPLGVQLYTVASELNADFDGTLAKLRAIGVRTVETASFHRRTPVQLRASFDRAGLLCTSAHVPLKAFLPGDPGLDGDLDTLAASMHVIGATTVVMPSPPIRTPITSLEGFVTAVGALTRDDWMRTAETLNRIGKSLHRRGITLGYHNHNFEFAPQNWGTAFDLLLRETDPTIISFEMDAGWVAAAGIDPIALLSAHPNRFTQMHIKDIKASTTTNFKGRQDPTEVGSGKMNWPTILPAAYAAGVRGFFVEQEPPFAGPPIDSIAKSAAFLLSLKTA